MRDTIPDFLLMRMRRTDARMLSGMPTDDLPDTANLPPGHGFLLSGEDGAVRVVQPQVSAMDVSTFASATLGRTLGEPEAGLLRTGSQQQGSARGLPEVGPRSAQGQRVVALLASGATVAEVTDELSGVRDRSSGTWKNTRRQVETVITDLAREAT
ncbi:MAG: hypothetical protein GEV09_26980 [Pseudonocardiaceae bacterium]|nr:hypothetical protein [Pseudonocardiaceae bacterium]